MINLVLLNLTELFYREYTIIYLMGRVIISYALLALVLLNRFGV